MLKLQPIEHERSQISDDALKAYQDRLKLRLDGERAEFVFNCDESGFDAWADCRRHVSCLVPPGVTASQLKYPVKRNEKRITMLGCISAAGDALKPLCITSRRTVDSEVLQAGYTPDRVAFAYSGTGYITEELFRSWLLKIFVPHIEHLRARRGLSQQRAVLILDNCTCHESDEIDAIYHKYGIDPMPLVPHASHLTQQLDIGIFGNVKQAQSRIHPNSHFSVQSQQLLRMLGAWVQITHPMGVTSAFARSGVRTEWRDGRLVTFVDEPPAASSRIDVSEGLWPDQEVGPPVFDARDDVPEEDWEPVRHEKARVVEELLIAAEEIDSEDDDDFNEEGGTQVRRARFGMSVPENRVAAPPPPEKMTVSEPRGWSGRPPWLSLCRGQDMFPAQSGAWGYAQGAQGAPISFSPVLMRATTA